jgi:osmoprotectant transport system substrate-binding protein
VRAALGSGDIDAYWEYTGTGWITHLQQTENITDPQKLYQAVAAQDLEKNNITWLPAAPANNTYAVAVSKEKATELGVSTVSDYAELASTKPDQASFCGASEFFGRGDGWPGLQKSYGFTVPKSAVAELAAGPIYNSIDKAKPCNFGEVFATDGRVEALGLTVLEDDKKFFAVYNPALTVRKEVVDKYPKLSEVVAPVAAALDDATLRSLNAKVDVAGDTPEVVAKEWLQKKGFVK